MPTIERHAPGEFCWVELATSNQSAAKSFYSALFGWTANDVPMGPHNVYTLLELQGRIAASTYTMDESERAAGVPPHWKLYVAVANADESAKRAEQLGAKVVDWPWDIGDRGRAAVLLDPCGAPINLWQPNRRLGIGVAGDPGSFCWADLVVPDQTRAKTFYQDLFGWQMKTGANDSGYLHIVNGEKFIGGIPPSRGGEPPHWLVYFEVPDVEKTFQRAIEMSARSLLRPMEMERNRKIAMLADPQGAVFALHGQMAETSKQ